MKILSVFKRLIGRSLLIFIGVTMTHQSYSQYNYGIFDNPPTTPQNNGFLSTNLFPGSGTYPWLRVGYNFATVQRRALFYGGNIGLTKSTNSFGTFGTQFSELGNYTLYNQLMYPPGPYYVSPGERFYVTHHQWGNYAASFGLRERTSDMGNYMEVPPGDDPNIAIKDAVINWFYEPGSTPSRLIFNSIEGVSHNQTQKQTELMTLLHNGNLGLGSDGPTAQFQIKTRGDGTNYFEILDENDNSKLIAKSDGKIGINNPNPDKTLDVIGSGLFRLTAGSSGTDRTFGIQDQSGTDIFYVQDDKSIYLPNLKTANHNALFIDPNGKVYAAINPNPNIAWIPGGNWFPAGVTSSILGSWTATDVAFMASGANAGRIIGNTGTSALKGCVQFYKNVAIGGPSGSPAAADLNFALTLRGTSATTPTYPFEGALRCVNGSSGLSELFAVRNSQVNFHDQNLSVTYSTGSTPPGQINPMTSDEWDLGTTFSRFNALFVRDISCANIITDIATEDIIPITNGGANLGSLTNKWNEVFATNGSINTSDIAAKKDIKELSYGLDEIMKLEPVTYRWKESDNGTRIGLIAQEVEKIIPEVIVRDVASDRLGMRYSELIPLLVKGIQEQQLIIKDLQTKIDALQSNNNQPGNTRVIVLENRPQLFQNRPNPFAGSSLIEYYLPENCSSCYISITDELGRTIQKFNISQTGYGSVQVEAGKLAQGTYRYSLYQNSQVVDTKTMMIVRD